MSNGLTIKEVKTLIADTKDDAICFVFFAPSKKRIIWDQRRIIGVKDFGDRVLFEFEHSDRAEPH